LDESAHASLAARSFVRGLEIRLYAGDFSCDFFLLEDVKEWMSYKCSRLSNLITTSLSNLLLHILQKEKIATKIAAKIARVNGPLHTFHTINNVHTIKI
jgi:hypothetical protein